MVAFLSWRMKKEKKGGGGLHKKARVPAHYWTGEVPFPKRSEGKGWGEAPYLNNIDRTPGATNYNAGVARICIWICLEFLLQISQKFL